VREIAHKYDLSTKAKKDSTGICFIGERNFKNFLSTYVEAKPGNFELLDGTIVGKHSGAVYYTLGQRKGLGLGGQGAPWFVLSKDMTRNVVIVERGDDHPALYTDTLTATDISWINSEFKITTPFKCSAKVRYRQTDQTCTITKIEGDRLFVEFDIPQRAVTPRQSIVFYQNDICLGGAMIEKPGKSYFELGKTLA
jgi:tRNA-specific 2-thiouridylase